MKQTAVEWLAEQVKSTKWTFADITDRKAIVEQAKQMEREQIEQAFNSGMYNSEDYFDYRVDVDNSTRIPEPQTYYNETYKHS